MTFPSKGDTTLSAWALAYAEFGWPVFPLKPRNKQPLTTQGFHDASVDPEIIEHWWTQWPEANIGLPTGKSFDVLDIDGPEAAAALKAHIGHNYLHQGPVSKTGKGWHLLFEVTDRGNGAKLLPDTALDFRGIGGYIVAPPSMHPKGHRYEWTERDYTFRPAAIPKWLMPLLTREARDRTAILATIDPTVKATVLHERIRHNQALRDDLKLGIALRTERPNILEVFGARWPNLPIRQNGKACLTTCIFHDDSTPSFALYPDNTFHCFGCGAHGDSFDLLNDPPTHI